MKSLDLLDDLCRISAQFGYAADHKALADLRVQLLIDIAPAIQALDEKNEAKRLAWPEFTSSAVAELAESDE